MDDVTLNVGDRIRVQEATQHALPEGYNWINSAPIIKGFTTEGNVLVTQVGYPYMFVVERALAEQMRAAWLKEGGQ